MFLDLIPKSVFRCDASNGGIGVMNTFSKTEVQKTICPLNLFNMNFDPSKL